MRSQSATAPYRKEALDLKRIGEGLGVRYVLEGNLRRAGPTIRVTCQLVEAATGAIVWTQMFARPLSELAELQDELVTELVGHLGAQVRRLEMERALRKPGDWTAWEAVARSISYFSRFDAESQKLGELEARRAVALAPEDAGHPTVLWKTARALASIGLSEKALPLAERSIALMPYNAIAHGSHGRPVHHEPRASAGGLGC
ncbi:MAG: hypothetical protein ACOYJ6_10755 [Caulobacterales bacterium]